MNNEQRIIETVTETLGGRAIQAAGQAVAENYSPREFLRSVYRDLRTSRAKYERFPTSGRKPAFSVPEIRALLEKGRSGADLLPDEQAKLAKFVTWRRKVLGYEQANARRAEELIRAYCLLSEVEMPAKTRNQFEGWLLECLAQWGELPRNLLDPRAVAEEMSREPELTAEERRL